MKAQDCPRWLAGLTAALLLTAPAALHAMCCPVPCHDCWISSTGQANLVVMDRAAGIVRLVPNIVIAGMAEDFALVVPTPAQPQFAPVSREIWDQAQKLTAPVTKRRNDSDFFGCGRALQSEGTDSAASSREEDVVVHDRVVVGAFDVTVISSTSPNALLDWLIVNEYSLSQDDADKFAPYVARGWFFTAMKLDRTDPANQMPAGGWNARVDPVEIRYAATEFEAALPIASINRATWMPVLFYVVDDHRAALQGANTLYANRLSESEYRGITRSYPEIARFMSAGQFVTALSRAFTSADPMDASVFIQRAPNDDEFRRGVNLGAIQVELSFIVALAVAVGGHRWRNRWKRATAGLGRRTERIA